MAMLSYEKPRLIAVVQSPNSSNETRLVITGGLPRLPGTATAFPHGYEPPPYVPPAAEVGTCTEGADVADTPQASTKAVA